MKLNVKKTLKIMADKNISYSDIARQLNVTRQAVNQYFFPKTDYGIGKVTAVNISKILGTSLSSITRGDDVRESVIQNRILRFANTIGVFNKIQGSVYTRAGTSDIIGCLNGHYVAIEAKRAGRNATRAQIRFIEDVRNKGGIAFVAHSVDEVEHYLRNCKISFESDS